MSSKLTKKQAMFCKEYIVDLNATQAAIRSGYSEKTANRIGHENLTKLDIQSEIQKLMDKRAKKVEISAEDVLQSILDIRQACIKKAYDKEGNEKLTDATSALKANELIGKHLKLFTDKVEHSGEVSMPIINIVSK